MQQNIKSFYKFSAEEKINATDGSFEKRIHNFAIIRPNRKLKEDGELFFASETSRFAKAGVLPKAAWGTILSNSGGTISDEDRQNYGKLLVDYRNKSFELQSILIKSEGDRTSTENSYLDKLTSDLNDIRQSIQAIEAEQIGIFDNTAEAKARNRTVLWWLLNLSYKDVDGKLEPVFVGETFENKLDAYDDIEQSENNDFIMGVVKRLTYLITLWFLGRIENDADFESFDKIFQTENAEEDSNAEPVKAAS